MLVSRRLAFVIGCALLASCGGGDSGSTPPPTGGGGGGGGTPTPTPTPAPSYQTIAQLTGDQRFSISCATYTFSRQFSPNFSSGSDVPFGNRGELRFAAAPATWTYAENPSDNPLNFTFGPADLVASPPANTTLYRRTSAGRQTDLSLRGAQQTGFSVEYLRVFLLTDITAVAAPEPDRSDRLCIYGVPTVAADTLPASATAYTSLNVLGTATRVNSGQRVQTYALGDSTATLSVNGTAGTVTMTIQLVGREILPDGTLAATTIPLPALTAGNGTIANRGTPAIRTFEGNFTTGGIQELSSNFSGAFFGPQGREAGFSFFTRPLGPIPNEYFEIAGNVVARR